MISFNPHLMYKSVTDDLVSDPSKDYVSACLKQLIVDEVKFKAIETGILLLIVDIQKELLCVLKEGP